MDNERITITDLIDEHFIIQIAIKHNHFPDEKIPDSAVNQVIRHLCILNPTIIKNNDITPGDIRSLLMQYFDF